ncbi:hypothetical protein ACIBO2_56395, partial [Nonomuraea sp. NPDC050022]
MAIRRSATKRHGLPTIVQLRLTTNPVQADALAAAVLLCNQAATVVSRLAWQHRTLTLPKPVVREPVGGFVGVDQGVVNLAVTSDGAVLPGPALPGPVGGNGHVRTLREWRHRQRR